MIALIDYGSGNIRSVQKALEHAGGEVELVSEPARLADADAVVLPGVGDFGDCARGVKARGLWEPLRSWLGSGRPFLGICVGYQLMFESSEEAPGESGFGFFKGSVQRFRGEGLKVPQIGWNNLEFTRPHPLWNGLPDGAFVFFVHSFYPVPVDAADITARTDYGVSFAAAAARGAAAGVQFHPEKSQETGLQILRNFIASCPAAAAR